MRNTTEINRETCQGNNLIIYGINKKPNESSTQLLRKVTIMIEEKLNIVINMGSIDQIKRLGEEKSNGDSRPVLF